MCADMREAITVDVSVEGGMHSSWGLIADHHSVYAGTDRTLDPLVVCFQHLEAPAVHQVAAG